MGFEEQEKILEYLAQRENKRFCHLLAEKLSNAGVKVELNFKIETMEEIKEDGIHLGYRPEYCLDDVIVDFEEHDACIKNRLIQELINKMPNAIDRNDGYGIKELYAVHKIISKMED